ncbi:MAG: hypothetical protein QM770_06980 [Tepidisphaeraceae bacterium]
MNSSLAAPSLVWDAGGVSPLAPADGAGTWDTSTPSWSNGTTSTTWIDGSAAIFGSNNGAAGTVTLGTTPVVVDSLTFNAAGSGSYVVGESTNSITIASGKVSVAPGGAIPGPAPLRTSRTSHHLRVHQTPYPRAPRPARRAPNVRRWRRHLSRRHCCDDRVPVKGAIRRQLAGMGEHMKCFAYGTDLSPALLNR